MERMRRWASRIRDQRGFGLVEVLIALTILVIGLVAVSGLTVASANQAQVASWRSDQAAVGQLALERAEQLGYADVASGMDTVTLGGHDYAVKIEVTDLTSRVRQVTATVAAVGEVGSRTFTTRLYRPRPLPSATPPTSP